jgi:hypothetical protein
MFSFMLADSTGNVIFTIAPSQVWLSMLIDNTVSVTYQTGANGNLILDGQDNPIILNVVGTGDVWRTAPIGATTSTLIGASHQSQSIVWQGAARPRP